VRKADEEAVSVMILARGEGRLAVGDGERGD
jgi:hypothetical protein